MRPGSAGPPAGQRAIQTGSPGGNKIKVFSKIHYNLIFITRYTLYTSGTSKKKKFFLNNIKILQVCLKFMKL